MTAEKFECIITYKSCENNQSVFLALKLLQHGFASCVIATPQAGAEYAKSKTTPFIYLISDIDETLPQPRIFAGEIILNHGMLALLCTPANSAFTPEQAEAVPFFETIFFKNNELKDKFCKEHSNFCPAVGFVAGDFKTNLPPENTTADIIATHLVEIAADLEVDPHHDKSPCTLNTTRKNTSPAESSELYKDIEKQITAISHLFPEMNFAISKTQNGSAMITSV